MITTTARDWARLGIVSILLTTPQASDDISRSAADYLDQALRIVQTSGMNRKQVDWPRLRDRTLLLAGKAQTTQETYPALALACTQPNTNCGLRLPGTTSPAIADRVKQLQAAADRASHGRALTSPAPSPFLDRDRFSLSMLHKDQRRFAYIVIPFSNNYGTTYADPGLRHTWAEDLFTLFVQGSELHPQGWILDLRGNAGGYTAPMLAGVQGLLGEGKVLQFRESFSSYVIQLGSVITQQRKHNPHTEEHIDQTVSYDQRLAPVAILTDHSTQGAAEELAIAFKGRDNSCFFGEQTGGKLSHGLFFNLADGAVLFVATARTSDRNGISYPEGLGPDVPVPDPTTRPHLANDQAVTAAMLWLTRVSSLSSARIPRPPC